MRDKLVYLFAIIVVLPFLYVGALVAGVARKTGLRKQPVKPKLLWAGVPLGSLSNASRAMISGGFDSVSVASTRYPTISASSFDHVVSLPYRLPYGLNSIAQLIRGSVIFLKMMYSRDVLHGFFNGGVLGRTPLIDWEYRLWKLAGNVLILMPYGSDGFIYAQMPDTAWSRAVMETYPRSENEDQLVENRVLHFSGLADSIIGCIVHDYCLPRTDHNTVLWYPANLEIEPVYPSSDGPFIIAHATNHRKIKGSDHVELAVAKLTREGFDIELIVVENQPHDMVLAAFSRAHIVIDQLLFGYALSALEAMALGKPVISGISDDKMYQLFRDHSYLDKAPVIEADPDNLSDVLRKLLENPDALYSLGKKTRKFAEKFHGNIETIRLYSNIYRELGIMK